MKHKPLKLRRSRERHRSQVVRAANILREIESGVVPNPDTPNPNSPPSLSPDEDSLENKDLQHLGIFFYLIPVVGFFPALWTLYRSSGSREQIVASRLSITLALSWLAGYFLLETGAKTSEFLSLPLLLMSSLLTSSYFLVSLWLMFRLTQRRHLRLPFISRVAEQVVAKRLS